MRPISCSEVCIELFISEHTDTLRSTIYYFFSYVVDLRAVRVNLLVGLSSWDGSMVLAGVMIFEADSVLGFVLYCRDYVLRSDF